MFSQQVGIWAAPGGLHEVRDLLRKRVSHSDDFRADGKKICGLGVIDGFPWFSRSPAEESSVESHGSAQKDIFTFGSSGV